jgi:hypothetical protein
VRAAQAAGKIKGMSASAVSSSSGLPSFLNMDEYDDDDVEVDLGVGADEDGLDLNPEQEDSDEEGAEGDSGDDDEVRALVIYICYT